jgi:hypothetical protein
VTGTMTQTAPYPQDLAELVTSLRYRRHMGWRVWLDDDLQRDKPGRHKGESRGLTLVVQRCGPDTHHPDDILHVNHYFAVPAATYNRESWMRWLFDRLGDVDTHERMEDFAFKVADNPEPVGGEATVRPYSPCHGPGWDPYLVTVERTETDRRTSFRGELNPE